MYALLPVLIPFCSRPYIQEWHVIHKDRWRNGHCLCLRDNGTMLVEDECDQHAWRDSNTWNLLPRNPEESAIQCGMLR